MKVKLLKKIRQRYDYYFVQDTGYVNNTTQLKVLDKKTGSNMRFTYPHELIKEAFKQIKNEAVMFKTYYDVVIDNHGTKENIRNYYRNKKKLSLTSRNLTIRQILDYRKVRSFKHDPSILHNNIVSSTLTGPTTHSIAIGNANTILTTLGNNYYNSTSNGFVTATTTANGTPMLTYP